MICYRIIYQYMLVKNNNRNCIKYEHITGRSYKRFNDHVFKNLLCSYYKWSGIPEFNKNIVKTVIQCILNVFYHM